MFSEKSLSEIQYELDNYKDSISLIISVKGTTIRLGKTIDDSIPIPMFSITKSFVSYLCFILAIDGVISLDQPIFPYFEMIVNEERTSDSFKWEEVTIRDLLCHLSGILADKTTMFLYPDNNYFTYNNIIKALCKVKCDPIRQTFIYSDIGYILVGYILEKVTSLSIPQLFEKFILKPLSMSSTTFFPSSVLQGVTQIRSQRLPIYKQTCPLSFATDGICVPLADMERWLKEIYQPTLISKQDYNSFIYPRTIVPDNKSIVQLSSYVSSYVNTYSHGYYSCNYKDIQLLSHSGGADQGLHTFIMISPKLSLSVFMVAQTEYQYDFYFKLSQKIIDLLI
jgi:CubicO group peptidase (beta-lactamase class C family)